MKNLILIVLLIPFTACNDSFNESLEIESKNLSFPTGRTTQDYYDEGYDIGTGDADWLVDQTWIKVNCVESKFKTTDFTFEDENGFFMVSQGLKLDKNQYLTSCLLTTVTQELAFDEFISIYPYKDGYTQILEDKIASTNGNNKAFYQGILAGFKNRLCGWSITMPFNFTYCDAIDLPGSEGSTGGPSTDGPEICIDCDS